MASRKLQRIENPSWAAPILRFTIERHGGTVRGSSRADIQRWEVNLDQQTAKSTTTGFRQLRPNAKRLDVTRIAEGILQAISTDRDDPLLEWSPDRSSVRLLTTAAVEPDGAAAQTIERRRKRLNSLLGPALKAQGWRPARQSGRYERNPESEGE